MFFRLSLCRIESHLPLEELAPREVLDPLETSFESTTDARRTVNNCPAGTPVVGGFRETTSPFHRKATDRAPTAFTVTPALLLLLRPRGCVRCCLNVCGWGCCCGGIDAMGGCRLTWWTAPGQTKYTVVNRDTGELYDVREIDTSMPYRYSVLPHNMRVPSKARQLLGINERPTHVPPKAAKVSSDATNDPGTPTFVAARVSVSP